MLSHFRLGALIRSGDELDVVQVPLIDGAQEHLRTLWANQYRKFVDDKSTIEFDPGYNPEAGELFKIDGFELPEGLADITTENLSNRDSIGHQADTLESVVALLGFATKKDGTQLILFQRFNRAHVIAPGRFLFFQRDSYRTPPNPGIHVGDRLAAVFEPEVPRLLFFSFPIANTFLPLSVYFTEASRDDIERVLGHKRLKVVDCGKLATQLAKTTLYRKQFAMLEASNVLENYEPKDLRRTAKKFGVSLKVQSGCIVVPSERQAIRTLLKFLNEQIFRGAITNRVFETNSKREVDS